MINLRVSRIGAVTVGVAAFALVLSACGSSGGGTTAGSSTGQTPGGSSTVGGNPSGTGSGGKVVKVGMAYDVGGRGDKSFNDLAAAGLDKAKQSLSVQTKELAATNGESEQAKESRLQLLAQQDYNPIVAVGFAYATAVGKIVPKFPDTKFAIVDDDTNCTGDHALPNLTCLLFTENQSSFLVGVAAALATKTKNVGFIGGVNEPLIQMFQAGFQDGVHTVNKSIKIQVKYLSQPPDFSGFSDPAKGKTTALGMYNNGADVVYHAAGGSGAGLFDAAKQVNKLAIGVDSDQYLTAPADEKGLILTSALKGVDVAVYNFITDVANGKFKAGDQRFSLKDDGVGYSTSNPKIKPYEDEINQYKEKIISGQIVVPTKI